MDSEITDFMNAELPSLSLSLKDSPERKYLGDDYHDNCDQNTESECRT